MKQCDEWNILNHTPVVPAVSVIIPCYNAEKYLTEMIASLEMQTCKDFEVICVNDGSTDSTLSLLEEWHSKGNISIHIIDKENAGVSSARNDGIKAAHTKYILFLDADDCYHEKFIEQMLGAVREHDADVAYCRLSRKRKKLVPIESKRVPYSIHTQEEAMNNLLYRMGDFGFYCYIYKKDLLQQSEISFSVGTSFGEDREFIWKYLSNCKYAIFVDAALYWYRVNEDSVTRSKASWRKTDTLYAVKRVEKYLSDIGCPFAEKYQSYMYSRVMWGVAKTFVWSKDRELFDRLQKEYDVKACMKRTAKDHSALVRIASWLYLIHPMLFYYAVGLKR